MTHKIRWLIVSGWLITIAYATDLKIVPPEPISGTPFLWNKYPEVVLHHRLAKPAAGDTTFFIRKNAESGSAEFDEVAFYRLVSTDSIEIYAEVAEFDAGRVTRSDAEQVRDIMLNYTPEGSINPDKGIYSNEIDIFGEPPDVDHNGKLFVLLIDVRDNYEAGISDTYIAGYFDPLDQRPGENYGEIIYIDTNPANVSDEGTLSTVAHELQHLIHNSYDSDEKVWVTEGLSELAPRLLGLPVRSFASFLSATNNSLMDFDGSMADYAKVGLWTFYIYRRFGLEVIKEVVSNTNNSFNGFSGALSSIGSSITTKELLSDWFIANLLNDPTIGSGQYSYGGASIAALSSDHFHVNFADGEQIALNPAAAEYIQFYSGSKIDFEMNYQSSYSFGLAIVKNYDQPEVEFVTLSGTGTYPISDETFGSDYTELTIIPYWPAEIAADAQVSITYSATGIGSYVENELEYDRDSLDYFIQLNDGEAAQKFDSYSAEASLTAIKILTYDSNPVTIRVYNAASGAVLLTIDDFVPNDGAWTKLDLDSLIDLRGLSSFLISVASSENSLGYSAAQDGTGHAFVKSNGTFYDLSYFNVTQGSEEIALTGNWAIRAIVREKIVTPPHIILNPDSLWFWQDEYTQTVQISNGGSEPLEWEITTILPNWLNIEPLSGTVQVVSSVMDIFIDRNLLKPGITEYSVPISSNGGSDSLYISVLKRNAASPQAALVPVDMEFSQEVGRITLPIFNIGPGASRFGFWSEQTSLQFLPPDGYIPNGDTLGIEVFLDREAARDSVLGFYFFDGVDTLEYECIYHDWISDYDNHFTLLNPFPNPFLPHESPHIYLPFRLKSEKPVTAFIFNILGQEVFRKTINNPQIGLNVCTWDGRNPRGIPVTSGVYIVVIRQGDRQARQKLLLMR